MPIKYKLCYNMVMLGFLENKKNNAESSDNINGRKTADSRINSKEEELREAKLRLSPRQANIKRYLDPEGLSVSKMNIGLWLVTHRKQILFLPVGFLIIISILTWAYTIYGLGYYIFFGMKQDKQLASELLEPGLVGHDFFLSRAAKAMLVEPARILKSGVDSYDILAVIANPNEGHWGRIIYRFIADGEAVYESDGFILPGERKYLLALNQKLDGQSANIKLVLDEVQWSRIDRHEYPDWPEFAADRLNIAVEDIVFTPAKATVLTEKINLNDLHFSAINNTIFNYYKIDFVILLYQLNNIIGVNKYSLSNFMSNEKREINITWPGSLSRVDDVVIVPEINITRDDIYIYEASRVREIESQ